mgnify:FL=1
MRYDLLAREALRGVVRMALERPASPDGLPGDHHVYLTFRTTAPGVQLPARLHERYPEDMTIVLKSHFWDLDVGEEGFSVSLSFDQVPERLTIPYPALVRFYDPEGPFGLEFDVAAPALVEDAGPPPDDDNEPSTGGDVVSLDAFRKR